MHFLCLLAVCCQASKVHETTTLLLVTFPNIHRFKKFTRTLSNKPFLISLLTTQPHLKYVATLPCNSSLVACFADNNVLQGSVATYARCGEIFNVHVNANLLRNLPVHFFLNRLRFDRIMVISVAPLFWPTLYMRPLCLANACEEKHRYR